MIVVKTWSRRLVLLLSLQLNGCLGRLVVHGCLESPHSHVRGGYYYGETVIRENNLRCHNFFSIHKKNGFAFSLEFQFSRSDLEMQ